MNFENLKANMRLLSKKSCTLLAMDHHFVIWQMYAIKIIEQCDYFQSPWCRGPSLTKQKIPQGPPPEWNIYSANTKWYFYANLIEWKKYEEQLVWLKIVYLVQYKQSYCQALFYDLCVWVKKLWGGPLQCLWGPLGGPGPHLGGLLAFKWHCNCVTIQM